MDSDNFLFVRLETEWVWTELIFGCIEHTEETIFKGVRSAVGDFDELFGVGAKLKDLRLEGYGLLIHAVRNEIYNLNERKHHFFMGSETDQTNIFPESGAYLSYL